MIRFDKATVRYDSGMSIRHVSFSIKEGEFVYLYGPSGSGKSSILKMIYMDLFPNSGDVEVFGLNSHGVKRREIARVRQRIGMIFQDPFLLLDRDIYSNIALPLELAGTPVKVIQQKVSRIADEFGLRSRLRDYPYELSGGEQQRVSLARAVINDPELLLADEPTAQLDTELSTEIINWFWKQNQAGKTVIFSTHKDKFIDREPARTLTLASGELVEDFTR
jgi:cell division transport system ATP-binding protein